jgi:hypothetical protein
VIVAGRCLTGVRDFLLPFTWFWLCSFVHPDEVKWRTAVSAWRNNWPPVSHSLPNKPKSNSRTETSSASPITTAVRNSVYAKPLVSQADLFRISTAETEAVQDGRLQDNMLRSDESERGRGCGRSRSFSVRSSRGSSAHPVKRRPPSVNNNEVSTLCNLFVSLP